MLSFALKIAWVAVSLTGLLSCWVTLIAFANTIEVYWSPILYCIAATLLEGVLCLGLIWNMNPFTMPKAFCITQTAVVGFAIFLSMGICASWTIATAHCMLRQRDTTPSRITLSWRPLDIIPAAIFPIAASAAQISVMLKLEAVKPTENMWCDATHPIWLPFLSYAGVPWLLILPLLLLSLVLLTRVFRASDSRTISILRETSLGSDKFTQLPSRPRRSSKPHIFDSIESQPVARAIPSPSPSVAFSLGWQPSSPGRTPASPALPRQSFHLPFSHQISLDNHETLSMVQDDAESTVSSSFPTFAPPSQSDSDSVKNHNRVEEESQEQGFASAEHSWDWNHVQGTGLLPADDSLSMDSDAASSLRRTKRTKKLEGWFGESDAEPVRNILPALGSQLRLSPNRFAGSDHSSVSSLTPLLLRFIIFQLLLSCVQILNTISPLLDVVLKRSKPAPFGTQHIGFLLLAWLPLLVFGHMSGVWRRLMFWR